MPATLGPMACISKKFCESFSRPTLLATLAAIGTADTPAAPTNGLILLALKTFMSFAIKTPEAVPLPKKTVKKIETKKENKQNPDKLDEEVKQVSEFEKKEFVDLDNIAKLIDKAKEDTAELIKKNNDITQDQDKNIVTSGLTLSEEDALKAQIFGCWSIPLGLPYNEDLLVRIKLMLEPDGSVAKTEILDHARMNKPGQGFYKVLAESALRAVKLCQPLRVPTTGYERWKELQLNFDAREMLEG